MQIKIRLLALFIGFASLISCQKTEGCLDALADNFDVSADTDCQEDCDCTYPDIKFNMVFKYNGESYNKDSIYTNSLGQEFKVVQAAFFISNISLFHDEGTSIKSISRRTQKLQNGETFCYTDDLIIADTRQSTFTKASMRHESIILDSVRLNLGFNENLRQVDFSNLSSSSIFIANNAYLKDSINERLLPARLHVHRLLQNDTIALSLTSFPLDNELTFPLIDRSFSLSDDISLDLTFDFMPLLQDIDLWQSDIEWSPILAEKWPLSIQIQ